MEKNLIIKMKKTFKIKKGTREQREVLENIRAWIYGKLETKYYDKEKKHYVEEIQKDVIIEVNIKIK